MYLVLGSSLVLLAWPALNLAVQPVVILVIIQTALTSFCLSGDLLMAMSNSKIHRNENLLATVFFGHSLVRPDRLARMIDPICQAGVSNYTYEVRRKRGSPMHTGEVPL